VQENKHGMFSQGLVVLLSWERIEVMLNWNVSGIFSQHYCNCDQILCLRNKKNNNQHQYGVLSQ